jgi:hypothetical protein
MESGYAGMGKLNRRKGGARGMKNPKSEGNPKSEIDLWLCTQFSAFVLSTSTQRRRADMENR